MLGCSIIQQASQIYSMVLLTQGLNSVVQRYEEHLVLSESMSVNVMNVIGMVNTLILQISNKDVIFSISRNQM
jgi:hypothetical protein